MDDPKVTSKKDEKILIELTLNSRIPINQLAKKVGVSREVANYRLQNLKKKIINEFYTIIDTDSLGFLRYGCFFQLKGISPVKEKEFISYLTKHDFATYIGPVIGKWNVVFDIFAKDNKHMQEIVKEIVNKVGKHIEKYAVIGMGAEYEGFPVKIFGSKREIIYNKSNKNFKIEKKDLKILKILSNNSRVEYKEIAGKLKMSANAIKYRIKNLEASGVIKGYTISINKRELGYEFYNLQIKIGIKNEESLKNFLRNNKHTTYFYRYLGNENWDLDIGLIVKNSEELREFIISLREKFEEIKIYDIYVVFEESKGDYAPEGVFKET
jgi:Lrp/AsnC family leucine-responsive transcriptional regulator